MTTSASQAGPRLYDRLQSLYGDEIGSLEKSAPDAQSCPSKWQRKAEILQAPDVQRKMTTSQLEAQQREVRETLEKMESAKQSALRLIDELGQGVAFFNRSILTASENQAESQMSNLRDLTSKQARVQELYNQIDLNLPQAESEGEAILSISLPRMIEHDAEFDGWVTVFEKDGWVIQEAKKRT